MAFDYSSILSVSTSLIESFGKTVTVRQEKSDTDKAQPWLGKTDDVQTYTTKAVIIDPKTKDIDGTLVKVGDRFAYISPEDETFPIKLKDYIVDDSVKYSIVNVERIEPGSTNVLYILTLRI